MLYSHGKERNHSDSSPNIKATLFARYICEIYFCLMLEPLESLEVIKILRFLGRHKAVRGWMEHYNAIWIFNLLELPTEHLTMSSFSGR